MRLVSAARVTVELWARGLYGGAELCGLIAQEQAGRVAREEFAGKVAGCLEVFCGAFQRDGLLDATKVFGMGMGVGVGWGIGIGSSWTGRLQHFERSGGIVLPGHHLRQQQSRGRLERRRVVGGLQFGAGDGRMIERRLGDSAIVVRLGIRRVAFFGLAKKRRGLLIAP